MDIQNRFAALFLDYENIYYFIRNKLETQGEATDCVVQMVNTLRQRLVEKQNRQCIISHAYADFERIDDNAQGPLYLIGVESHNVLGTDHKNAADMQLCIHALETMYTRPEIETFVFMAGDRDYIPVIQHLRKHAKTVWVVAFQQSMSGDLLMNVGEERFIDGISLLPGAKARPEAPRPIDAHKPSPATTPVKPIVPFSTPKSLDLVEQQALLIMLEHFSGKTEIWVTPYLHRLRNEMPLLAEYERRALITTLSDKGVVRVEKRVGEPTDYSVMLINWDHPDVRRFNVE